MSVLPSSVVAEAGATLPPGSAHPTCVGTEDGTSPRDCCCPSSVHRPGSWVIDTVLGPRPPVPIEEFGERTTETTTFINTRYAIVLFLSPPSKQESKIVFHGITIFLAAPRSLWDLSSLTRDVTHTLCIASTES